MTGRGFEDFIGKSSWQFAKTMPHVPHWYTLRKNADEEEFVKAVKFIREEGYDDWYYRKKYRAINVGRHKYWTMGAPVKETTLINRKEVRVMSVQMGFDEISKTYDKIYSTEEFLTENQQVIDLIGYNGGSVLDIGCGTGLLLDYLDIGDYTGIDPSLGMLKKLKEKHSGKNITLVNKRYEDWQSTKKFDHIISLFGSASYISYAHLSKAGRKLKKGGKMFLMSYKPKKVPHVYTKTNIFIPHFPYKRLPRCSAFEFNNYIVCVS